MSLSARQVLYGILFMYSIEELWNSKKGRLVMPLPGLFLLVLIINVLPTQTQAEARRKFG